MVTEVAVVVRVVDRVMFSVLEVKVTLEPGSVVFILSRFWKEKAILVRMFQRLCECWF